MVLLLALAALAALACCAAAEGDPLQVRMSISKSVFAGPEEITVSIQVTNTSEQTLPGPVTLYYPDRTQVEEFGEPVLGVGESRAWTGAWTVTQEQLDEGYVAFSIRYSFVNDDGDVQSKTLNFKRRISQVDSLPETEIDRTVTPSVAAAGQTVAVTYSIANVGTVSIENVTIAEDVSIAAEPAALGDIGPGQQVTYTFSAVMADSDLTSEGVITFRSSGISYTETLEMAVIRCGDVYLAAEARADKTGGVAGSTATITLTLTNSGGSDYVNLAVTEAVLGQVADSLTVPAGETVTLEIPVTLTETRDYQFIIADQEEEPLVQVVTPALTLTAIEASDEANMEVTLTADRSELGAFPGSVRFTVTLTNRSTAAMTDVRLRTSGYTLTTIETFGPGETRTYSRVFTVSMAGSYQFTVTLTDPLGESHAFESNVVRIAQGQADASAERETLTPPTAQAPAAIPDAPSLPIPSANPGQAESFFENLGVGLCLLLSIF